MSWDPTVTTVFSACPEVDGRSLVSPVNTPYLDKFIPANHLKKGEHLQTSDGQQAVADGGTTPKMHDGWMWDLTVPGNNDHDFYVMAQSGDVPVLVHNNSLDCGDGITVYRGVAEGHPAFDDAAQGVAVPRGGDSSAEMHQLGFTDSPYVSWTTSEAAATRAATKGAAGRGLS